MWTDVALSLVYSLYCGGWLLAWGVVLRLLCLSYRCFIDCLRVNSVVLFIS